MKLRISVSPDEYYLPHRIALRRVRQFLYPRRCPFCGRVLGSVPRCAECAEECAELRRAPSMRIAESGRYFGMLEGAAAPYRYSGCVRRGILRAKYQGAPWNAVELGVALTELAFGAEIEMRGAEPVPRGAEGFALGYDCVIPVPASSKARGYNVPELMAIPVTKALGLPLENEALYRLRSGRHQAGLPLDERLENVAGAFAVRDVSAVEGRRVLLIDDVITTGATAAACTQALLDAGAQSVFALALATRDYGATQNNKEPIDEDDEE